jgi:5-methylcytosine-specific restriction protein A
MLSQAMAQGIEHRSLDKLIPYPKNPRCHSDVQFAQIAAGLIPVDSQVGMMASPQGRVRRILRPCSIPGCPELTPGGPCESHRRIRQREHDERRGSSRDRGYDADHRRLRVLCFQRDGWRCVDCGWEPEIVRVFRKVGLGVPPAQEVLDKLRRAFGRRERHLHADHQVPIEDRPDLRLDLDNLRTRCDGCHRAKTVRETRGTGRPVESLCPLESTPRATTAQKGAGFEVFLA